MPATPPNRIVVECLRHGQAEMLAVLVRIYLRTRRPRLAGAATSELPLPSDVMANVTRFLDARDRHAASATCRAWCALVWDPLVVSSSDATVAWHLGEELRLLANGDANFRPYIYDVVDAWTLTKWWLDGG
jgi:hypothetical protein